MAENLGVPKVAAICSSSAAVLGVNNLVVVETADALLITTRENTQDVGKIVKHLDEKKLHKLV